MDAKREFDWLARQAIGARLVTRAEVRLVGRYGTRKAVYAGRHLADLRDLVADRKATVDT